MYSSFLMQVFCFSQFQIFAAGDGPVFGTGVPRRAASRLVHVEDVVAAFVIETGSVPVKAPFTRVIRPKAGTILQVWQMGLLCAFSSSDCSGLLSV